MIPHDPDHTLDALLRRSSELPSIPDDGFTARVLAALPVPRREQAASTGRRRTLVCLIGGGLGAVVAISQGSRLPPLTSLGEFWIKVADDSLRTSSQVATTLDVNLPVLAQIAVVLFVAALLVIDRPNRPVYL